ncbi:MAG: NAD(P)H-hydrate dehydratase [Actinobacteria bacterium]|jgi:NAD(P)H-hydrate epimerase|nr:NAD(P)H-hydrate dehydratase [Actinomycetota bacterium]
MQEAWVGLDLVEVARFEAALCRHPRLKERVFTPAEISYCRARGGPALHYAARFAAKEAVGKLLGSGVVSWQEIEVLAGVPGDGMSRGGAPKVTLSGRTAEIAHERGIGALTVSLSHVDSLAGACVAAVARPLGGGEMDVASYLDSDRGPAALRSLVERPAVFTPTQVRELDRATIEDVGVPGPVLMERAALGVTLLIQSRYPGRHTLIVCGRGNNGGDGLAAARQLHLAGHPVACVVTSGQAGLSPDAALNFRAAEKTGVNLRTGEVPDYLWDETEVVVDCLLGTGAGGELRGRVAEWASLINAAGARGVPVVAVDVPTGVDAATGNIATGTVAADVTVTFHTAKTGLVCPPGAEAAGEVLVWDIGIPESLEPEPDLWVVKDDDVNVPGRRVDDHKYRAGYVAVLAGSIAYPGAAWLAAQAAYRAGAGYVRLLMNSGAADGVRNRLVEAVLQEIGPGDHLADAESVLPILADERLGALVVGPGLGRDQDTLTAVRRIITESALPAVLDADGLFAFAGTPEELQGRPGLVVTPHVGELAALLGAPIKELAASSVAAARRAAAATGQVVLLKGSSTLIVAPSGDTRVVVQGPPQLASAGTGDVLSGVIGALLAKGLEPFEAAYAGAWIHAEAGRLGALIDPQGILAGDLVEMLPDVIADRIYERGPSWRS